MSQRGMCVLAKLKKKSCRIKAENLVMILAEADKSVNIHSKMSFVLTWSEMSLSDYDINYLRYILWSIDRNIGLIGHDERCYIWKKD